VTAELDASALGAAWASAGLSGHPILLDETDSTMNDARRLADEGLPAGTAVLALRQTAGRGRFERRWVSPVHAVTLTTVLRPSIMPVGAGLLSLGASLAVREALGGAPFQIKWPNDVLAPDGKKVAGVLSELEVRKGRVAYVLVGVGVNVGAAPEDVPTAGHARAWADVEPAGVAARVVRGLLDVAELVARDPGTLLRRWTAASATIGRRVCVGGTTGIATSVTADGALVVATDDGAAVVVHSGDVVHHDA
jgi:BirA family biotin operon repressor/biotin-[acetyl-CoA-carboxylase] ligase